MPSKPTRFSFSEEDIEESRNSSAITREIDSFIEILEESCFNLSTSLAEEEPESEERRKFLLDSLILLFGFEDSILNRLAELKSFFLTAENNRTLESLQTLQKQIQEYTNTLIKQPFLILEPWIAQQIEILKPAPSLSEVERGPFQSPRP